MTLRFVPNTFTLDEQRQEINNLASDVNSIDTAFDERVDDRLSALLSGGTGISATYNDNSNSLSLSIDFTEFNTDSLTEGTNKLFFTQSRARESFSIAAEPAASGNGDLSYNSSTGVFTYTPPALTLSDITTNGNTTTNGIVVGGLTVNTNNSNFGGNIYITDATKEFGFYENGKIIVVDTATPGVGALTLAHRDVNGEETLAKFTRDGGAELYYNASKKLETTLTGVTITGSVTSSTLRIGTSPGTVATVEIGGTIRSSTHTFTVGSIIQFELAGGGTDVTQVGTNSITTGTLTAQSGVNVATGQAYQINGTNVLTATTLGSGVTTSSLTSVGTLASLTVTGTITANGGINLGDGDIIQLGDGNDLRIYHAADGSNSYIQDAGTGNLRLISNGDGIELMKDINENMARFLTDGAVELYYDNIKRFETTSTGAAISGSNLNISTANTPASATATGTAGDIRWDADYIYVCVATDTWKRASIATWT